MIIRLFRFSRASALIALGISLASCREGTLTPITSGFGFLENARPSLAEDGTVLAAKAQSLVVGDGDTLVSIDLVPHDLTIEAATSSRPARIRSGGEVVLLGNRPTDATCATTRRGAYHLNPEGTALTPYFEGCLSTSGGNVGRDIGLSPNGTVAFSQITNGMGALYRGPIAGPVAVLRSGTGTFFNTKDLDVNDAGQVAVQMEYVDGYVAGLMRAIIVFATPEQDKATVNTAIEKMSVGTQPPLAINASGQVAFALNSTLAVPFGGATYDVAPGVYLATPTLFNTPKALTQIANTDGPFCRFGVVDVNDAGQVAFEAALDAGSHCAGTGFDGIYLGPDFSTDKVVGYGDERLGGHQYFDTIHLGEINNAGQIAFLTTYSEPLVAPVMVWRFDP